MKDTARSGDAGKRPTTQWGKAPPHALFDESLSAADWRVYLAISSFTGGEEKPDCFFQIETLKQRCGADNGTISKAMRWLVHRRLIGARRQGKLWFCEIVWSADEALPHETRRDRTAFLKSSSAFANAEISNAEIADEEKEGCRRGNEGLSNAATETFPHAEKQENRPLEQIQPEQIRHNITHTAPAAASLTEGDARIKISLDLAMPVQICRMKTFRDEADGEQLARAAWREFLSERFKQDPEWIAAYPNTYLGRFRDWCRDKAIRQAREQRERAAGAKCKMSWEWKKRPEFGAEIWPHALRLGFTPEDALLQIDRFVRRRMGEATEKTPLEWKMDAANWLDSGMRHCLQEGRYVRRSQEAADEVPF